jgi:lipopolysaccharide transport system permease protein
MRLARGMRRGLRGNEDGVGRVIASIRALHLRRDLLLMLAWREITIKYKQSLMGFAWAILMPALIVSAGILVRIAFSRLQGTSLTMTDVALVSTKSVPWAFFVASIRFSSTSLISNADLISKIYMPREVFPLATILAQSVDLGVAAVLLTVVLTIAKVGVSIYLLWVPLLLLILFVLATGIGLLVSATGLFFRDVKYLVEVFVTFAIFFTPVFYEASMFGEWGRLLLLNPVGPILEGLAAAVVRQQSPSLGWLAYSAVVSAGIFAVGSVTFKRLEPYFAQSV